MGLFSRIGQQKEYPPLSPETVAAEQLANFRSSLESLVHEIPDKLEVVPADGTAFVFIGKPPKKFGIAWIEDGQVKNLQAVVKDKGIQPMVMQGVSEKLRSAYEKHLDAERFMTDIGGKSIIVTPCDDLKNEVEGIISKVTH